MSDAKPTRRPDAWGWTLIVAFILCFTWLCRYRFHMIHPGEFLLLSLGASLVLVLAMARLYAGIAPADASGREAAASPPEA